MAIHSRHERDTMQHATQDLTFFYFSINFWDNDILITFMKIYIYPETRIYIILYMAYYINQHVLSHIV